MAGSEVKPTFYNEREIVSCMCREGNGCNVTQRSPDSDEREIVRHALAACDEYRNDANYEGCLRQRLGDSRQFDQECVIRTIRKFWNGECTLVEKNELKFMGQTVPKDVWNEYFKTEIVFNGNVYDNFPHEESVSATINDKAVRKIDGVFADVESSKSFEVATKYFANFSKMSYDDRELRFADVMRLTLKQNIIFAKNMIELYLETTNDSVADAVVYLARELSKHRENFDGFSVVLAAMELVSKDRIPQFEYQLKTSALKVKLEREFWDSQARIHISEYDEAAKARYVIVHDYFVPISYDKIEEGKEEKK